MKYYLSESVFTAMLIVFFLTVFTIQADAVTVTTNPATGVTTNNVVFNGHTDSAGKVWFEYSGTQGKYMFRTSFQTMTGVSDFTASVSGIPLLPHQTYYYRSVEMVGSITYTGSEQSFTMNDLSQISGYNFDNHSQELINNKFDPLGMSATTSKPYTDLIGELFWGIIFIVIFIMIWMRQDDVTIPAILGMVIGVSLWATMPPEIVKIAYSLTIVSFAGIMYTLIKSRL